MRFHNPEYQPPVTGSRVTGCTNFVQLKLAGYFNRFFNVVINIKIMERVISNTNLSFLVTQPLGVLI